MIQYNVNQGLSWLFQAVIKATKRLYFLDLAQSNHTTSPAKLANQSNHPRHRREAYFTRIPA
jgi:hypothetical protein